MEYQWSGIDEDVLPVAPENIPVHPCLDILLSEKADSSGCCSAHGNSPCFPWVLWENIMSSGCWGEIHLERELRASRLGIRSENPCEEELLLCFGHVLRK